MQTYIVFEISQELLTFQPFLKLYQVLFIYKKWDKFDVF